MFEQFTESDSGNGTKISPNFRTVYSITIILSCFGLVFLYSLMEPFIYTLYGYDPQIVGTYEPEAFSAVRETYPARIATFYIVAGINLLCQVFSFVALYRQTYLKSYLVTLSIFIFSFLLMLFYCFALLVSKMSVSGVLG